MRYKRKKALIFQDIQAFIIIISIIWGAFGGELRNHINGSVTGPYLILWKALILPFVLYLLCTKKEYTIYINKDSANSKLVVITSLFSALLEITIFIAIIVGLFTHIIYLIQLKSFYTRSAIINFNAIEYTGIIAYRFWNRIINAGSTYAIVAYLILRHLDNKNMVQKCADITYNHKCLKWFKEYSNTISVWNWFRTRNITNRLFKKRSLILLYITVFFEWYFLIKTFVLLGYNIYLFNYIHIFTSQFIMNIVWYSLFLIFNAHYVHYFKNSIFTHKYNHWLKQHYLNCYNSNLWPKRKSSSR